MYIKIKKKKIEITECLTTLDKFKSLKFVLDPINYGIKIPKKKKYNTYFFCQRVDILVTDKEDKIIALFENIKSEKKKRIKNAYNIYYLPLDTCKYYDLGDKFIPKEK